MSARVGQGGVDENAGREQEYAALVLDGLPFWRIGATKDRQVKGVFLDEAKAKVLARNVQFPQSPGHADIRSERARTQEALERLEVHRRICEGREWGEGDWPTPVQLDELSRHMRQWAELKGLVTFSGKPTKRTPPPPARCGPILTSEPQTVFYPAPPRQTPQQVAGEQDRLATIAKLKRRLKRTRRKLANERRIVKEIVAWVESYPPEWHERNQILKAIKGIRADHS